jgi:hypothetical protein
MNQENQEFFNEQEVETTYNRQDNSAEKKVDVSKTTQIADNETKSFILGDLSDKEKMLIAFSDDEDIDIKEFKDIDGNVTKIKYLKHPLEIASVKILGPKLKNVDGDPIEPEVTRGKDGKELKFYTTKVEVLFKDSRYKALIPSVRWWVNGERLDPSFMTKFNEKLDMKFITDLTKTYWKYCDTFGYDKTQTHPDKVLTQRQFIEGIVGKNVILKEVSGFYGGKEWTKLGIDSFVVKE